MKYFLATFCIFVSSLHVKADSLWIETNLKGVFGKAQTIKVLFGFTISDKLQRVDGKFKEVKDFTCWVVSPSGKLHYLKMVPIITAYQCEFTPEKKGVYTILLENKL